MSGQDLTELLVQNDSSARQAILDAGGISAEEMVRGLRELCEATVVVWDAARVSDPGTRQMIDMWAQRFAPHTGWPGPGLVDPAMSDMVTRLEQVETSLRDGRRPGGFATFTRTRSLHALYLVTHATSVALAERSDYLLRRGHTQGEEVRRTAELTTVISGFEQMLTTGIKGQAAAPGPVPDSVQGDYLDRYQTSMTAYLNAAAWALREPSRDDVILVAQAQAWIAGMGAPHLALHNPGCSRGLNPLASRSARAV